MSMGMTSDGHVIHAKNLFAQAFFLAWGGLPPGYGDPWTLGDTPPSPLSDVFSETVAKGPPNGTDTLTKTGIIKIVSIKQGATTYAQGVDFTSPDGNHISWALGGAEPAQGTPYTAVYRYYNDHITALAAEVGRREAAQVSYAVEDENGTIVANGTTWSISNTPTRNLYIMFKFDANDAVGSIIHQVGMYVGTTRASGVSGSKKYLLPNEVGDPGLLYLVENIEPFSRVVGKREIFEYILTL